MTPNQASRFFAGNPFSEIGRWLGSRRRRPSAVTDATVSVVIPVKNAGDPLRTLLSMLRRQVGPRIIDIVVIDSGSQDASLQIARDFGARVVQIPAEQFSHSRARNLGAEQARGEYLLFTVQDALPPSEQWLQELFAPIRDHSVVAVSCGESPREDADLFYRAISRHHHRFLELDAQDRILSLPLSSDPIRLRKSAQLSDTACLIRSDVFSRYRFRGDYAEDLDLGLRLIRDGFRLALLGSTRILHSHNRPAYYHLRRGYVDQLALLRILPDHPATVVEPRELMSDIVHSHARLREIAATDLQCVALPCSPRELGRALSSSWDPRRRARSEPSQRPLDAQWAAFLDRLGARSKGGNGPAESTVIRAMRDFAELLVEYAEGAFTAVDEALVEEIGVALYKGWALQCGVLLASAYAGGDEAARAELRDVDPELRLGV